MSSRPATSMSPGCSTWSGTVSCLCLAVRGPARVDHDQSDFCQVRPVLADVSMKSPPRPQSPATRPASSGQEADPQIMSAERPDLRALLLDLLRASVEHNGGSSALTACQLGW